ncbi:hypothetical protein TSAR_007067 [Trichomalopsis sarcophagae]|uniref:Uncharacterized protein n=1 Tax=Trichomalopsis sarcophagae TaxID=543379 RepID=A0A232FNH7_9HYME|nr:hypothetical protein TSAR_007067 [Trichomalopsis sarcophagae]
MYLEAICIIELLRDSCEVAKLRDESTVNFEPCIGRTYDRYYTNISPLAVVDMKCSRCVYIDTSSIVLISAVSMPAPSINADVARLEYLLSRHLQPFVQFELNSYGADKTLALHLALRLKDDNDNNNNNERENKIELVKLLLKSGASAKQKLGKNGETALHVAVKHCTEPVILRQLLDAGVMLNATTRHEKLTALHIAVKTNDRLAVEEMLNRGVRIDAQSRVGDTALHLAVKFEFKALVQLLLDHGADPNCQNDIGETPFTSSLGRVKDRISNLMLSETAVKPVNVRLKNHAGETALHFATLRCYSVTVFKTLLNLSHLNLKNDWILLFHVIKNPNSSIRMQLFRALLKHGTDLRRFVNKDGQTLLCLAVHFGSVDVAKYLLESEKVDVNGKPGRKVPLFGALRNGNEVAVNLLLRHDARVDLIDRHVCDQSSVHAAILGFDDKAASRVCKRLLDYGAPLDHLDSNKNTALIRALRNCRERVASLLIARGANVHLKNLDGLSPLHIASNKGLIDTVKKLLDAGANVNEVTNMGSSVLEYATYSDSEEAVKLILEHGANCRTDSRALLSALAFHQKNPQITKLLLAHGADINLKIQDKLPLAHTIHNYKYSSSSSLVLGYLLKHIALLDSQGQPVQQENLELIDQYEDMKNFYEKSVRQLEIMRSTRVCQKSPVTYFDLLTKRHDGLVRCLRCKKLTLAVRSNADKSTFPFYFNDMLSNYNVGLRRLSMLQKLQVLLQDVLGNQLPCELIKILCQYFNDKELEAYRIEPNNNNADAIE